MMDWEELDKKYGFAPAPVAPSADPWEQIAAQHVTAAMKGMTDKPVAQPVTDFSGNLRIGPLDTGIPLLPAFNKGLAQIASGIADYGMVNASPAEVDAKRKRDAELNAGFVGGINHFAGKVIPTFAIPTIGGPVAGGALAGSIMGAAEPVGTGESRTANTLLGAALGTIVPGGMALARKMADGPNSELALKALNQYDIPVGVSDASGSRFVKAARSVLNDTPFVGLIGDAQEVAKQQAFNRANGKLIGVDATKLDPTVMEGAKRQIGGELNRIWEGNTLKIDPQYINDLSAISTKAAEKLNPEQAQMIDRQIQTLLQKANNAEVPGGFVNNWQSELRMAADGEKGLAQSVLSELRKSTLAAFNRGVTGPDAAALSTARQQYGAYKTLAPLMNKSEAGVAGRAVGDVPAALLPGQVVQQYGSASRSPFQDLPQIGSQFLVDRVPRTGGSVRAGIQNAIVGSALVGGPATAGAVAAGTAGGGLGAVAGLGGAALIEKLLGSPTAARALLNSPQAQRRLLESPDLVQMLIELSKNGAARVPAAVGMGMLAAPALE